jgi:hypothetical protein
MRPTVYIEGNLRWDSDGAVVVLGVQATGVGQCWVCQEEIPPSYPVWIWDDDLGAIAHDDCVEVVEV